MTDTDAAILEIPPSLPGLDPHTTARDEVRRIMEAEQKPLTAIAKQVDVAYGTFSAWMNGTYAGNNKRILDAVENWLNGRKTAERTRVYLRKAPDFLPIESSDACVAAFEHAQFAPDLVVVSGPPGVGKTQSCLAYVRRANAVWMITAEPLWSTSPRMLMESLLEEIGCTERLTRHQSSRAIVKRVAGSNGLIMIDEAQHLSTRAMDQLRTIHDKANIGVVLVGNETVHSRLEGHARDVEFAQLFSRVGMRVKLARSTKNDVDVLLNAWGVTGEDQRTLLRTIARKPGALRGMTKTLRLAHMRASVERRDVVSRDDIAAAWTQISNSEIHTAA